MSLPLPPTILRAIANRTGQVTVITGAGCSLEPPTCLPLSKDLAKEAHRRLVNDGVISATDCDDPEDLSKVAATVWEVTNSQHDLVEALPRGEFRAAKPNRGHLNAAALLREGALSDIITLNFDLALSNAVTEIGGGTDIKIIGGPEQHKDLGKANIIYLHRNVECQRFDEWILTQDALEEAWAEDKWETVVVRRSAAMPIVIFAGLGSRAELLEKSVKQIKSAVANEVFLVEPGKPDESDFFHALELEAQEHIASGWVDFMDALAERIALDQRQAVFAACKAQKDVEQWPLTDLTVIEKILAGLSLLELGRLRAELILDHSTYARFADILPEHIADLLLAVARILSTLSTKPELLGGGLVAFVDDEGRRKAIIGLATGRGVRSPLSLEEEIKYFHKYAKFPHKPSVYLVGGVNSPCVAVAPPPDVSVDTDADDLITGPTQWKLVTAEEIRTADYSFEEMIA